MSTPVNSKPDAVRKKFDRWAPGARKLRDQIVHGVFLKEGTLVAFPLCFPGATVTLPLDESRVTALVLAPNGMVYGGTSGHRCHLFVGMFHGITGCVYALGTVESATDCPAVCCTSDGWVAAVNGAGVGRLMRGRYQPMPFDLIQEWGFPRPPLEDLGSLPGGDAILHALSCREGQELLVAVGKGLVRCCPNEPIANRYTRLAGLEPEGRMGIGRQGQVYGFERGAGLWRYDPQEQVLRRDSVRRPIDMAAGGAAAWAMDPTQKQLYWIDRSGRLFALDETNGTCREVVRLPLEPATTLAATHDGRLFGTGGEGMQHLFCFDPATGKVRDIGMALSVIERRRYGYEFADAVTGRDGQIYFAENDNGGHLWIYFPRIEPPGR